MLLQVKELENAAVELLATYEDYTFFISNSFCWREMPAWSGGA
jgi:hypothetical protein